MVALPLLAVGFSMKLVAVAFVFCSVILILLILLQKGKGGGLGAAFGGGMGGSLLGSKTGDFLTWVTIVLVGLFLVLAVVMAKFYKPTISGYGGETVSSQSQSTGTEMPSEGTETSSLGKSEDTAKTDEQAPPPGTGGSTD